MTKDGLKDEHKIIVDARRQAYREKDDEAYAEIVKHQGEMEQQYSTKILETLMSSLGISEQEFGMTHQQLMMQPQTQEFVLAAQQGKLAKPKAEMPKLSSQETLKHLKTTASMQEKQIQRQQEIMQSMPPGADEQTIMLTMMIEQHKMQDASFIETGVENDDFEASLLHYCQTDREIAMETQKYMMKMRGQMPGM